MGLDFGIEVRHQRVFYHSHLSRNMHIKGNFSNMIIICGIVHYCTTNNDRDIYVVMKTSKNEPQFIVIQVI